MTHQQEVAARIAQLRREKSARDRRDVLQGEIAGDIGISAETYSRYENGKRKVPEEVIQALAGYFGTTREFIRYGIGETPIATFQVPDEISIAVSQARRAKASAERPDDDEKPRSRAAGDRRAPKRPKGRQ